MDPMNIISYNVRGLGRGVKWLTIRRMVKEQYVDLLCLQETKKENVNKMFCQALWENFDCSWEFYPSVGPTGGILCIWNQASFKVESRIVGAGFI